MKKLVTVIVVLAIAAGVWAVFLRGPRGNADSARPAAAAAPAVPVMVTQVKKTPTPEVVRATGSVQPDATVAVKPRIDGVIATVNVKEASDVTAGQVLFTLDDRQQQVALQQAQAALARDQANLISAQTTFDRYSQLQPDVVVSRQTLDNARSAFEAAKAAIEGDQASVANAQLQLSYDTITAPIDGRLGFIALKQGNIVHASDAAPMVVINRVHPIQVTFAVPQRVLADVRALSAQAPLPVSVDSNGTGVVGKLAYIDNAVDQTTGTIQLRAVFDNTDDRLWPGLLVTAVLTLRTDANALVVPEAAVQQSQNGPYVWVIKPDRTAALQPVTVDRNVGGVAVISQGVAEGDQVVTDGGFRLAPGVHVNIKNGNETADAGGAGATR